MPTGSTTHAHEYRLLFAAPDLEEAALDGWWTYAAEAEDALVQADAQHSFSPVSLILVTGPADKACHRKKLKKLSASGIRGGAGRLVDDPARGGGPCRPQGVCKRGRRTLERHFEAFL